MFVRKSYRACLALMFFTLFTTYGWALRMIGGPEPISNPDLPAGSLKLANLPTRFSYSDFEAVSYQFIYGGGTAQFQTALDAFAAIDAPRLELFLYGGGSTPVPWSKRPVNWMFEVCGSGKTFSPASPWRRHFIPKTIPPPRLSVFLGEYEPIDWPAIHVPARVTVIDRRVDTSPWASSKGGVVHATVFDLATSRTLPGAILELVRNDQTGHDQVVTSSTANAAGDLVAQDVPAGNYIVRLRCGGYATREAGYYENYGRTLGVFERIGLSPAATLTGRVTDPGGQPIAGATVNAMGPVGPDGQDYRLTTVEARTDAAGRFTLGPLPRGRVALRLHKSDYQSYYSASATYPVPSPEVKIVMTRAGVIQGRVVGPDGKPATRPFVVEITPPGGNKVGSWGGSLQCREGGRFEFTSVPPGEYVITARPLPMREGAVSAPRPVTVEGGKTVEVELIDWLLPTPGGK